MSVSGADAAAWASQGQQALQAGRYEEAARAFDQAIQLAPTTDGLHYHYASACLWRGFVKDALGAIDRCLALGGPWSQPATQMLAQIRRQVEGGWGTTALGMVGAAALGRALAPGALDSVRDKVRAP